MKAAARVRPVTAVARLAANRRASDQAVSLCVQPLMKGVFHRSHTHQVFTFTLRIERSQVDGVARHGAAPA